MVADELEETRRREYSGFVAAQPKGCGTDFSIFCWGLSSLPSLGACGLQGVPAWHRAPLMGNSLCVLAPVRANNEHQRGCGGMGDSHYSCLGQGGDYFASFPCLSDGGVSFLGSGG